MFRFFKNLGSSFKEKAAGILRKWFPAVIDEDSIKSVENVLYGADLGTKVTQHIITSLRAACRAKKSVTQEELLTITSNELHQALEGSEGHFVPTPDGLSVICLIGYNGAGKTTTAAKLAHFYQKQGKSVMLAACDTFRAAANEQINSWAERFHFDIVSSQHGADAAAVAFDACQSALAKKKDILIVDTAGRLHVKNNLMGELQKIFRVIRKCDPQIVPQIWLVVDGTIGMNTLVSAQTFHQEIGLTGVIITKLDGSSAGGTLVGLFETLHLPIMFIGTGETIEAFSPFSKEAYIAHLLE